jgi:hypothetical protein
VLAEQCDVAVLLPRSAGEAVDEDPILEARPDRADLLDRRERLPEREQREAVRLERRHHQIGPDLWTEMAEADLRRRVDHHEVVRQGAQAVADTGRLREADPLVDLVEALVAVEQVEPALRHCGRDGAVREERRGTARLAGERRVPSEHCAGVALRVEVDHQRPQASLDAGEREVADERRLAHAPFLVGHRDDAHRRPQRDASADS